MGVTICCPGPVAALIPGSPRMVWGAKEMILAPIARSSSKMPLRRCVSLIATAAAHGLEEVWIARHPILAVGESEEARAVICVRSLHSRVTEFGYV